MTKKDYIALAKELGSTKPSKITCISERDNKIALTFSYQQWRKDVWAVMVVLLNDNPRFDKEKFSQAVGLE